MTWIRIRTTDDGDTRYVACYRDPEGRQRSAGTFSSRRAAQRAAHREEAKVRDGAWHDHSRGQVAFAVYVETVWLPSKQVETSTLTAYRSCLDKHFIPVFGRRPIGEILPSEVQRWVSTATEAGLSAASVRKYHTMLHSIFERGHAAQLDRGALRRPVRLYRDRPLDRGVNAGSRQVPVAQDAPPMSLASANACPVVIDPGTGNFDICTWSTPPNFGDFAAARRRASAEPASHRPEGRAPSCGP